MKRLMGHAFLAGGLMLASWCVTESANAQAKFFELSSTTFKDGQMFPQKVVNNTAGSPNCVGENVSPQLSWANPPAGTKSFAITMVDPEGRGGGGVNHWVAYGIAPDVTSLAEGEASKASPKFVGGKGSGGKDVFQGPCTPPNVQPHHYTIVIVATDFEPKELPPGLTREELVAKIVPASGPRREKGSAGLVGLWVKPN